MPSSPCGTDFADEDVYMNLRSKRLFPRTFKEKSRRAPRKLEGRPQPTRDRYDTKVHAHAPTSCAHHSNPNPAQEETPLSLPHCPNLPCQDFKCKTSVEVLQHSHVIVNDALKSKQTAQKQTRDRALNSQLEIRYPITYKQVAAHPPPLSSLTKKLLCDRNRHSAIGDIADNYRDLQRGPRTRRPATPLHGGAWRRPAPTLANHVGDICSLDGFAYRQSRRINVPTSLAGGASLSDVCSVFPGDRCSYNLLRHPHPAPTDGGREEHLEENNPIT